MAKVINTISAYRSLLQQDDYQIKKVAVRQLLNNVALHWSDIANDISIIQDLFEDNKFDDHKLVAILLSKIYFYLGQLDQALDYAMKSGNYFDVGTNNQFTQILVSKCIEKYIKASQQGAGKQYKQIVQRMIQSSLDKGDNKLILGLSLQTSDIDLFGKVSKRMNIHDVIEALLPHLVSLSPAFKTNILAEVTASLPDPLNATPTQYINLLHMLYIKNDFQVVAKIIYQCVKRGQKQIAYTLALEISEMHGFNKKVLSTIPIETQLEKERKILQDIIEGKFADQIHNLVLKTQSKTDPHYLQMLKKIEPKNSIAHGSAVMALSMLQAFTQDDSFLQIKENLEWASKCTHWNKFTAIASLGLIFRNNKNRDVFKKVLPDNTNADVVNHFPNGGALYGLGLLFTGTSNQQIIDFILNVTTNPTHNQNEVIMHGACLGLGLTAFASGNQILGDILKDILNSSTSIMGQASALAIGLIYAGTNNQAILAQLITVAEQTQHEKIVRSICLSIGLICFQNPSMQFFENLESNASMKLALPLYLACAYFKTSNPIVVKKLLKLSNDISNEVKRTAIIALGFVMYHDDKLYDVIKMLLYSYNSYIRYGCVMALAIGSKQTKEAIDLIWPLLTDSVDFVRQGVYVALSLLFQVSTNNSEPKLADFRKTIGQVMGKPHGQIMAKMGAILSIGLLDAGGRNMVVSLTTRSGLPKMQAVTGMLLFSQYWNWFPYLNFIGLALSPSTFIGTTGNLKIPKSFQLKSNCKPSLFDYPANIIKQQKKQANKKQNAKQLSTTTKAKVRAALKKKDSQMQVQLPVVKRPSLISNIKQDAAQKQQLQKEKQKEKQKQKQKEQKKQEQSFSILNNPTRIAQKQKKFIQFLQSRYTPVLPSRKIGISFLKDSSPQQNDDFLQLATKDSSRMDVEKPLDKIDQQKNQQSPKKDGTANVSGNNNPKGDDGAMEPDDDFQYDETAQLNKKKE